MKETWKRLVLFFKKAGRTLGVYHLRTERELFYLHCQEMADYMQSLDPFGNVDGEMLEKYSESDYNAFIYEIMRMIGPDSKTGAQWMGAKWMSLSRHFENLANAEWDRERSWKIALLISTLAMIGTCISATVTACRM